MYILKSRDGKFMRYNDEILGSTWTPAATYPTDGLISHWPLYSDVNDAYGSNDFVQNGTVTYVSTDWGGYGANMDNRSGGDSRDNMLEIASFDDIIQTTSYSFWFKGNLSLTSNMSNNLMIGRSNIGGDYYYSFCAYYNSNSDFFIQQGKSGTGISNMYYAYTVYDGDWHHIVWTIDYSTSPRTYRVYFDGTDLGTMSSSSYADEPQTHSLRLNEYACEGTYSDLLLYNRILTSNEANQLYNYHTV